MSTRQISFVIPAYNEEDYILECICNIREAAKLVNIDYEIIVCDNNSTDSTTVLAKQTGVKVVFEKINQFSKARNTGASIASGNWLVFIDADTFLRPLVLENIVQSINSNNYAGGSCTLQMDRCPGLYHFITSVWNIYSVMTKVFAGPLIFCRKDLFENINGFCEHINVGEDIDFAKRLNVAAKALNLKIIILHKPAHLCSGRKYRTHRFSELVRTVSQFLANPRAFKYKDKPDYYYRRRKE
jgi:glycosyltransferase involved in cell wall biosynthesis